MKKFLKIICGAAMVAGSLTGAALLALANPTEEPLSCYYLTNGTTFTMANGGLFIPANTSSNIYSTPFSIWRGRGYTLNLGVWQTNAPGTDVYTAMVRYGQVHYANGSSGTSYTTNWITTNEMQPQSFTFSPQGTTYALFCSNIPPTAVDNVSVGQLMTLFNNATNPIWADPSNTFVGVYP